MIIDMGRIFEAGRMEGIKGYIELVSQKKSLLTGMDGIHWEVLGIKIKRGDWETGVEGFLMLFKVLKGLEYEEFIFCLGNRTIKGIFVKCKEFLIDYLFWLFTIK